MEPNKNDNIDNDIDNDNDNDNENSDDSSTKKLLIHSKKVVIKSMGRSRSMMRTKSRWRNRSRSRSSSVERTSRRSLRSSSSSSSSSINSPQRSPELNMSVNSDEYIIGIHSPSNSSSKIRQRLGTPPPPPPLPPNEPPESPLSNEIPPPPSSPPQSPHPPPNSPPMKLRSVESFRRKKTIKKTKSIPARLNEIKQNESTNLSKTKSMKIGKAPIIKEINTTNNQSLTHFNPSRPTSPSAPVSPDSPYSREYYNNIKSLTNSPLPVKPKTSCCNIFLCFSIIFSNVKFVCAHIRVKFRDDLLIGREHSVKIMPECGSPMKRLNSLNANFVDDDEKKSIVLNDPKFGMFSLFKYHITRGYKNKNLKEKNTMYCSHVFSSLACLPILVFLAQWGIYISLIHHEIVKFDGNYCPNKSSWEKKLLMFAVAAVYFVKSFFLWDNLTDRTRLKKMLPVLDIWVMLDTFQEFGFNLLVYAANLWIIFVEDDLQNMMLNSLAMEFIMNIDNEFEEFYFDYLPEVAIDIYDNLFVSYSDNLETIEKNRRRSSFRCLHCIMFVPFKLLVLGLMMFPLVCFIIMFAGPICK